MYENQNNNLNNPFNNNFNILMNSYINDNDSFSFDNYQYSQTNHKFEIVNQDQFQICLKKNSELFSKNKFNILKKCITDKFLLTSFSITKEINEQIISKKNKNIVTNSENNIQLKRGRKKKNDYSFRKRNKFCTDNLIHRLKTLYFQKFLIALINTKIESCFKEQKYTIIKINSDIIKDIKNKTNLKLLNSTFKEFLSKEISIKCYRKNKQHNTIEIQKLLQSKFKDEFETILNMNLMELYKIFISKNSYEIIKNKFNFIFKYNYISLINKLDESDEYKEKLKDFCLNYIKFLTCER